jgi:kinesin family protein 2/24
VAQRAGGGAPEQVQVQGLTNVRVHSVEGMLAAVEGGSALRCTSTTGMNEVSSRSHAIIQVQVRAARGRLHGQLSFIDLAGSEKGCDTAENDRQVCPESGDLKGDLKVQVT